LVVGATAVIRALRKKPTSGGWLARLLERKRPKVAAVALANKMARIAWAVLAREQNFRAAAA
jgi:transposase